MLAKSLTLLMLGQLALAQTTTTSAASGGATNLPELVADVDPCILGCIRKSASQVDCGSSDLECLCSKDPKQFESVLRPCISQDQCDILVALATPAKIGRVCDAVKASPDPAALESGSRILAGDSPEQTGNSNTNEDDDGAATGLMANGLLAAAVALLLI